MLNALLVTDGRIPVGRAGPGLCWIFTSIAVHLVEMFRFCVIRLQLVVADRPRRRDATMVTNFAEVLFAQAKERRTVEFSIAADVIVRVRMQLLTVRVAPGFLGVVLSFKVDRARAPVVLLAWHVITTFEQENFLAGRRESVCQGPAACACADDDYVVMIVRRHD